MAKRFTYLYRISRGNGLIVLLASNHGGELRPNDIAMKIAYHSFKFVNNDLINCLYNVFNDCRIDRISTYQSTGVKSGKTDRNTNILVTSKDPATREVLYQGKSLLPILSDIGFNKSDEDMKYQIVEILINNKFACEQLINYGSVYRLMSQAESDNIWLLFHDFTDCETVHYLTPSTYTKHIQPFKPYAIDPVTYYESTGQMAIRFYRPIGWELDGCKWLENHVPFSNSEITDMATIREFDMNEKDFTAAYCV